MKRLGMLDEVIANVSHPSRTEFSATNGVMNALGGTMSEVIERFALHTEFKLDTPSLPPQSVVLGSDCLACQRHCLLTTSSLLSVENTDSPQNHAELLQSHPRLSRVLDLATWSLPMKQRFVMRSDVPESAREQCLQLTR